MEINLELKKLDIKTGVLVCIGANLFSILNNFFFSEIDVKNQGWMWVGFHFFLIILVIWEYQREWVKIRGPVIVYDNNTMEDPE